MAYVAIADRDHEIEHHDPTTFITKYIWSQDHKVIAIQYAITATFVGLVALVLSGMMRLQLGFPDTFSFITPIGYYQFITMHGMIMVIFLLTALFLGGFGNYLIPLMIGARDMVFPYMNMLSYELVVTDGQGISMNAPRQAGMSDWYLLSQLKNFKEGIRGTHPADLSGKQMGFMSRTLLDDQAMQDVVAYINTL